MKKKVFAVVITLAITLLPTTTIYAGPGGAGAPINPRSIGFCPVCIEVSDIEMEYTPQANPTY